MKTMAGEFALGFLSFFQGFAILFRNARLWKYAIVPLLIGIISFVALLSKLAPFLFSKAMVEAQVALPSWLFFGDAVLVRILLWIVLFFACATLSFISMRIIAGPINGLLAERVLLILGALKQEPIGLKQWTINFWRMLLVGLLTATLFTVIAVILFPISFVPGLNLAAGLIVMLIATLEVSDYSFEAQRMGFRARFHYFFGNLRYFLGFATAMGLVFFVPGFSLVLFPVAVVGAAQLVAHIDRRKTEGER